MFRILLAFVLVPFAIAVLGSCGDRVTDEQLTADYYIRDFLRNDPQAKTAYPGIWIDTVSRADQYGKRFATNAIDPLDYWVEVIAAGCTVMVIDSCAPDEFNEDDPCGEIRLDTGARAIVKIAQLLDTIVCRYHIVNRADSVVTVKNVKYKENHYALMAKLDNNQATYRGWRLYAIGRQRHGFGYTAQSFPVVDSIVLKSLERSDKRIVSRPGLPINYRPVAQAVEFFPGELLRVTAYTRPRFSNDPITDAYAHYTNGSAINRDWMGDDISLDPGRQIFEYDFYESSGRGSGKFGQVAIELFQEPSLRSELPADFANLIWTISYKLE